MSEIHYTTFETVRFGSFRPLAEKQLQDLVRLFDLPPPEAGSVLGGRTSVVRHMLDGVGSVVIKYYRRGGLISRFNEMTYLRIGKTRSQREYEMLEQVRRVGVHAPRPVAYAHRGVLLYHCWLVTEEVQQHRTLAELSLVDPKLAATLTDAVGVEINRLVEHQLHHVDLHPGNVLIDGHQHVFLIDFDKTRRSRSAPAALRRRYLKRWQRAVIKHRLPVELSMVLEAVLIP
jgi:3-deoxy-D-manno-octulosonic acid kinase